MQLNYYNRDIYLCGTNRVTWARSRMVLALWHTCEDTELYIRFLHKLLLSRPESFPSAGGKGLRPIIAVPFSVLAKLTSGKQKRVGENVLVLLE